MKRILLTVASATLLAAVMTQARSTVPVGQSAETTLRQMEQLAQNASSAADKLERAAEFRTLGKATHEMLLSQISGDLNQMAKDVKQLEAEKPALVAWEQAAVSEVTPVLADAAANTTSAIHQ